MNEIRTDCYWYESVQDMSAHIDCCNLDDDLYACPCTMDCEYFIGKKEVDRIIGEYVGKLPRYIK